MESRLEYLAPVTRRSSPLSKLRSAFRITLLGLLPCFGGDTPKTSHDPLPSASHDTIRIVAEAPIESMATIKPKSSLIGKRVRLERAGHDDIILAIEQSDGELELTVNGKRYGVASTMGVSVGRVVHMVNKDDNGIHLSTSEYGEARVNDAMIEQILSDLAASDDPTVTLDVDADFSPLENTPLAAAVKIKRIWKGWKPGEQESFSATFVRRNETMLATDNGGK